MIRINATELLIVCLHMMCFIGLNLLCVIILELPSSSLVTAWCSGNEIPLCSGPVVMVLPKGPQDVSKCMRSAPRQDGDRELHSAAQVGDQ